MSPSTPGVSSTPCSGPDSSFCQVPTPPRPFGGLACSGTYLMLPITSPYSGVLGYSRPPSTNLGRDEGACNNPMAVGPVGRRAALRQANSGNPSWCRGATLLPLHHHTPTLTFTIKWSTYPYYLIITRSPTLPFLCRYHKIQPFLPT